MEEKTLRKVLNQCIEYKSIHKEQECQDLINKLIDEINKRLKKLQND